MDIKKAYEILEFKNPTKDREAVEKKYERLLIKYKNKEANKIEESKSVDDVTEAYKLIIESIDGNQIIEIDTRQKKLEHFWDYYKFHVIIPIVAIIFIIYFITSVVFKEQPDLTIIMQGDYIGYSEAVEDEFNKVTEDIDYTSVILIRLNDEQDPTTYSRNRMKSGTLVAANEGQFYILDKIEYERVEEEDASADLSKILNLENIDNDRLIRDSKDESIVNAVKLENNNFIKEEEIKGNEFYLVIIKKSTVLKNENDDMINKNKKIIKFINEIIK